MTFERTSLAPAVKHLHYEYSPDEVLLPYQKYWLEDDSELKIAEKSRRTGLTWAEAADATLTAAKSQTADGSDHMYIGSGKEMAREFIDAVSMWAKAFNKAASKIDEEVIKDGDKDITVFRIDFASGHKVQALSSNPSNVRGRQGNVTIDEAGFQDQFAEVIKAVGALTMWGSKIRIISTHNGVENLFNEFITESRAGKKDYSVHTLTLDDACFDGLYKRICQLQHIEWSQEREDKWKAGLLKATATEEDALEEYYCVPKSGSGVYLPRSYRERAAVLENNVVQFVGSTVFNGLPEHLRELEMKEWLDLNVKPLLDVLPKNLRHCLGEDFARSGDLTVFAPFTVHSDTKKDVPFLVELSNVPFRQQEQALYYICDRLPRRDGIKLDARGNGQFLAEQAKYRYGEEVEEVMLSTGYYRENMPRFKSAFEDDEIRIPKNEDIINDFSAIQIIRGVPSIDDKRTQGANGAKRHGDSAIAIFLGFLASKADITKYELHTIGHDDDSPERRFFGTAEENAHFDDNLNNDLRGHGIRL